MTDRCRMSSLYCKSSPHHLYPQALAPCAGLERAWGKQAKQKEKVGELSSPEKALSHASWYPPDPFVRGLVEHQAQTQQQSWIGRDCHSPECTNKPQWPLTSLTRGSPHPLPVGPWAPLQLSLQSLPEQCCADLQLIHSCTCPWTLICGWTVWLELEAVLSVWACPGIAGQCLNQATITGPDPGL